MDRRWVLLLVAFSYLFGGAVEASDGDADPAYRDCIKGCEETGIIKGSLIKHCHFSSDGVLADSPWYMQEPLYVRWKQWNCKSDCQYHCMMQREKQRETLGLKTVKYHGKWPFKRVSVFQEPVSAILSALTLLLQFNGWLSFFFLVYYKLPLRPQSVRAYYEFAGLWHIYGLLSMNAWFWSAIYHTRDSEMTEKLAYSSAVALVGYSLILAIMRTLNVRTEASRVIIAAPFLAFLTTHILYLNFYELDHGLNAKVCYAMEISNLLVWGVWAAITRHPCRLKLWVIVIGGFLAMFLHVYDHFPPYEGYVDAHALWHATAVPLTCLWWSFVKKDAEFRTASLTKKSK